MEKKQPSVSVIIPVKNEAAKIRSCIEGILSQTIPVQEIIVIDSGSTDGTVDILKSFKEVTLIEIPGSTFNHGLTRNLGVQKAGGEYVLMTVGDARPCNEYWIEELLKGFDNENVAGVCGQQVVPHDKDKNPVEWFRPATEATVLKYHFPKGVFETLLPQQKKEACGWDDVTAMYRKKILEELPFRETSYSEDAIWAKDALQAGYTIVYNTAARVYHYHLGNKDFTFKRSLTTLYFRYKHFGYITPLPSGGMLQKVRLAKMIFLKKELTIREKIAWWKYNLVQQRAIYDAIKVFKQALQVSEKNLDAVHEQWCGKPPIPVKQKEPV